MKLREFLSLSAVKNIFVYAILLVVLFSVSYYFPSSNKNKTTSENYVISPDKIYWAKNKAKEIFKDVSEAELPDATSKYAELVQKIFSEEIFNHHNIYAAMILYGISEAQRNQCITEEQKDVKIRSQLKQMLKHLDSIMEGGTGPEISSIFDWESMDWTEIDHESELTHFPDNDFYDEVANEAEELGLLPSNWWEMKL